MRFVDPCLTRERRREEAAARVGSRGFLIRRERFIRFACILQANTLGGSRAWRERVLRELAHKLGVHCGCFGLIVGIPKFFGRAEQGAGSGVRSFVFGSNFAVIFDRLRARQGVLRVRLLHVLKQAVSEDHPQDHREQDEDANDQAAILNPESE